MQRNAEAADEHTRIRSATDPTQQGVSAVGIRYESLIKHYDRDPDGAATFLRESLASGEIRPSGGDSCVQHAVFG